MDKLAEFLVENVDYDIMMSLNTGATIKNVKQTILRFLNRKEGALLAK